MAATYAIHALTTGWHVDQAILSEDEKLVVIRFGAEEDEAANKICKAQDEILYKVAPRVSNFATIYTCNRNRVPDFDVMYELSQEPMTIMFFYRNKHMMCDFGTGNNNKINWLLENKTEMTDIIEVIFRGARKGRGLVISPKDYSTRYRY
ncbi:MAG: hypothetical protein Q9162_007771 [Coniocarpon cinnabarinum]